MHPLPPAADRHGPLGCGIVPGPGPADQARRVAPAVPALRGGLAPEPDRVPRVPQPGVLPGHVRQQRLRGLLRGPQPHRRTGAPQPVAQRGTGPGPLVGRVVGHQQLRARPGRAQQLRAHPKPRNPDPPPDMEHPRRLPDMGAAMGAGAARLQTPARRARPRPRSLRTRPPASTAMRSGTGRRPDPDLRRPRLKRQQHHSASAGLRPAGLRPRPGRARPRPDLRAGPPPGAVLRAGAGRRPDPDLRCSRLKRRQHHS